MNARIGCLVWPAVIVAWSARAGTTWPTLHKDYQRSGYTDEFVKGPYERKWYRDFHDEMIATRVEAIVAEGRCYVGTFAGKLYALKVEDGSTAWKSAVAGPIGASACYEKGRLYFGADEGSGRGGLYCVRASDGEKLWRYEAGAGIWVAPACDGKKVYFGDRAGVFHAVDARTGKGLWKFKTGYMILTPASFSLDEKKIVFGSEDMHVYCLTPDGKLLWKSKKLAGLSVRDHAPTIWRGLAIVRTNPADGFHVVLGRNGHVLKKIQRDIPVGPGDKVLLDKWNDLIMRPTPGRREAENKGIVEHLRDNPHDRTFHALRLEDGTEPWIASVFYTCGLHNPPTAPTFNPRTGELYTLCRSATNYYLRGVRRYSALGRLSRETGLIEFCWPDADRKRDWYGMPLIGDETQALSLMGDVLVGTHQGDLGALHLKTIRCSRIWNGRDTYGGIYGPGALPGKFKEAKDLASQGYLTNMPNEWHGPDRSIVAIAEGRVFWVVGSLVVCLGGPDTPRTATGGTRHLPPYKRRVPPAAPGGNVASGGVGGFDEKLRKLVVRPDEVLRRVEQPPRPARQSRSPLAREIRGKLDAEVAELVDKWPWAPFIVELGISREERHFWRTALTMQTVSLALPHLSPGVKTKAGRFLDALFRAGCPLAAPLHPGTQGKRREFHDLGPGMTQFARRNPRYRATVEDLYALWAYAHYAGRWNEVLGRSAQIRQAFDRFAGKPFKFDHDAWQDDPAEHLNGRIAGVLAYARLMKRAGAAGEAEGAVKLLAQLVTERVHHERADTRFVRQTGNGRHSAKVPRYVALVPEVSGILREHAGEELEQNVRGLSTQLPVWYHAFGERMIGGENYISPPHLARGLFAALADGVQAPPEELVKYLDRPWCRADLYYIEKLSATLRALLR